MRLFDNLVGVYENEFNNIIGFYLHCYKNIVKTEKNKKEFLLQLRELRHDLRMCGIVIPALENIPEIYLKDFLDLPISN